MQNRVSDRLEPRQHTRVQTEQTRSDPALDRELPGGTRKDSIVTTALQGLEIVTLPGAIDAHSVSKAMLTSSTKERAQPGWIVRGHHARQTDAGPSRSVAGRPPAWLYGRRCYCLGPCCWSSLTFDHSPTASCDPILLSSSLQTNTARLLDPHGEHCGHLALHSVSQGSSTTVDGHSPQHGAFQSISSARRLSASSLTSHCCSNNTRFSWEDVEIGGTSTSTSTSVSSAISNPSDTAGRPRPVHEACAAREKAELEPSLLTSVW